MIVVNKNPESPPKPPEKKTVMTIFRHDGEGPVLYTLHAFNVDNEEDDDEGEPDVSIIADDVADDGADTGEVHRSKRRGRKTSPVTLLQLRRDEYPLGMGFVFMEEDSSKTLYFLGGQFNKGDVVYSSKKVFSVNLTPLLLPVSIASNDDTSSISMIAPTSSLPFWPSASSPRPPSSFSGSGSLLSVHEAPRMHTGKCNPIVIAAYGKIYVLSSGCHAKAINPSLNKLPYPNPSRLEPPPSHFDDDAAEEDLTLFESCKTFDKIFEVFDPKYQTWTVLPTPNPEHYSTTFSPTVVNGHSVVNGMLLFSIELGNMLVYHINCRQWGYFWGPSLPPDIPPDPCFQPYLLLPLIRDGICGRGVLADDTTHFVFNIRHDLLCAQHIGTGSYNPIKSLFPVPVKGSDFYFTEIYGITGGLKITGLNFVYLGHGYFCAVLCDYDHRDHNPGDVHVKVFKVIEEKCFSCVTDVCNAKVFDSYVVEELNTKVGSVLYCFALDKISEPNGQSKTKDDIFEVEDDAAPSKKLKLTSKAL